MTLTSLAATVIPASVEYLNPKSFSLSSILDVSVVRATFKTWEIKSAKNPFLKAETTGIPLMVSLIFTPLSIKNLSSIVPVKLSGVGSLMKLNFCGAYSVGKISLKINFPYVVTKYFSRCSSVIRKLTKLLAGTAIRE